LMEREKKRRKKGGEREKEGKKVKINTSQI
jgi:hypothetical protein